LKSEAPELEPNGSPAWLVWPGILAERPRHGYWCAVGFELRSGLSSLTTSLASDLSNLGSTINVGTEVDVAAGRDDNCCLLIRSNRMVPSLLRFATALKR